MRSHHVMFTRPALRAAALSLLAAPLLLATPASAVEYDGNWQFTISCTASGTQPAFTERFTAPITQNVATRTRSGRNAQGTEESSRFNARVEGGQMTTTVERSRGADRWSLRFAGAATSDSRFDLAGGIFSGDRQLRTCRLVAEALSAAPGSLIATAPARAEAARQQLATALAALEANAAAEAQALRTDLDLARFESVAMRAELDQRGAAILALETRLRTAEGAATQAQAALTQAVAAATTERTALAARLATAEASATQAQAQAQAAGAAAAQLRTALETAQRELTEARAAQPPR